MIFDVIGVLGFLLFAIGFFWIIKLMFGKIIVRFNINDVSKVFEIKNIGLYNVILIGGKYIDLSKGYKVYIENVESYKKIPLKYYNLKYKNHSGVELCEFRIDSPGKFQLHSDNPNKLIMKSSSLLLKKYIEQEMPKDEIEIMIKKTIPQYQKILSALFCVIGINIFFWIFILLK